MTKNWLHSCSQNFSTYLTKVMTSVFEKRSSNQLLLKMSGPFKWSIGFLIALVQRRPNSSLLCWLKILNHSSHPWLVLIDAKWLREVLPEVQGEASSVDWNVFRQQPPSCHLRWRDVVPGADVDDLSGPRRGLERERVIGVAHLCAVVLGGLVLPGRGLQALRWALLIKSCIIDNQIV